MGDKETRPQKSQIGGKTNWETSPARRTQHPSQGESQVGDKLGDKPSEADTAPQPR